MKVIKVIAVIVTLAVVCGYIYVRAKLTTDKPPIGAKATGVNNIRNESVLDLRPKLIEKLQQMIRNGSNGLYKLSIEKAEPDLLASKIELFNVHIIPDKARLSFFENNKAAPEDVFNISFQSLHIDGIGIEDILSKKNISLKKIFITNPVIEVVHQKRAYNKSNSKDASTLYQKLMQQVESISVEEIVIQKGSLITKQVSTNKTIRFNDVAIHLKSLLIDSTTQYDKGRFLFAREADISFRNFVLPTIDNLYLFKAKAVSISATKQKLTATNVSLVSKDTKQQFQKKLKHRQVMYNISVPVLQLSKMEWWDLFNAEGLKAEELTINNAKCTIYLDRSLAPAKKSLDDFPHQLLSKLSIPVHVNRVDVKNADIVYQEYNPLSKNTGSIFLSSVNLKVTNLTNIPEVMKRNDKTILTASAVFMKKAGLSVSFEFDLSRIKTGAFTANIKMGTLDNEILNLLAEPMGLFSIKKGSLQKATATIRGDNYKASGKVLVLYNNLHITPLKPTLSDSTDLKKKHVTSFIANIFLIKDENPSKGKAPRSPDAFYKRTEGSDLFNLVWKTMLVGTLKTIGINPKYAVPKN
jgi:hypothetical protein